MNKEQRYDMDLMSYQIADELVVEMIDDGWSLRETCIIFGLDDRGYSYFYRKYRSKISNKENGKSRSSVAGFARKRKLTINDRDKVEQLYKDGKSLAQIGELYGTTVATVLAFCRKYDIERRTKTEVMQIRLQQPGRREQLVEYGHKSYAMRRYKRTSIEQKFAEFLDVNGIKYIEQYRKIGNKHPYDFFLTEHNLLVEIDGSHWHNMPKQKAKDTQQEIDAINKGYHIFRITSDEMKEEEIDTIFNRKMEELFARSI